MIRFGAKCDDYAPLKRCILLALELTLGIKINIIGYRNLILFSDEKVV